LLRVLLEEKGIKTNDEEFAEIMQATTEDIKFNNINFKRRTSRKEVIDIALRAAAVLKRC
jgi:hypothetical protein